MKYILHEGKATLSILYWQVSIYLVSSSAHGIHVHQKYMWILFLIFVYIFFRFNKFHLELWRGPAFRLLPVPKQETTFNRQKFNILSFPSTEHNYKRCSSDCISLCPIFVKSPKVVLHKLVKTSDFHPSRLSAVLFNAVEWIHGLDVLLSGNTERRPFCFVHHN